MALNICSLYPEQRLQNSTRFARDSFSARNTKHSGTLVLRLVGFCIQSSCPIGLVFFAVKIPPRQSLNPISISPPPVWYCRGHTCFLPPLPMPLLHTKPPRVESHEGVSVTPSPRLEREGLSECMRGGPVTNQQTIGWGSGGVERFSNHVDPFCPNVTFLCLSFLGYTRLNGKKTIFPQRIPLCYHFLLLYECLGCGSALYGRRSMFLVHVYVQRLYQTIQFSLK